MNRIIYFILLSYLFIGCNRTTEPPHDHEHEEVKLLITGYSDQFEVFAEADPFVTGVTSEILAHFTHLEDFKPLTNARVTINLVTGTQGIRQTIDTPVKAGIFKFSLQPTTAGNSKLFFDISVNDTVYRVEGGRFNVYDNSHDAIHAAEEEATEHPAAISFTKEQSWIVEFATDIVKPASLGVIIKTVGEVLPEQGDEVILSARTNGIIRFVSNSLYEGSELRNGEVLLNVSGSGLAEGNATQRYREARSNYDRARANYERMSTLAESQIVSQADLLQARNEYETTQSVFENLSQNFSESGQQMKSPFNGYLASLYVANGEYVEAGQPVASIMRESKLVIRTEVQPRYASLLPTISDATIRLKDGNILTLSQLDGSVLSYARTLDRENHLLPLHLGIKNHPGIVPGSLLDVYLKSESPQEALAVPSTSLIEEQGNYFVFVQLHPESFEKREVRIGQTDGIYTEIVQGLAQNERVVSKGAMLVKMAAASGTIDPHSGHVH